MYSRVLEQDSHAMQQNSRLLEQYSSLLEQYSRFLEQYSRFLEQYSRLLEQYSRLLQQCIRFLEQYRSLLKQYSFLLNDATFLLELDFPTLSGSLHTHTMNSASATAPQIPFDSLLTAISDKTRWRILDELFKGEALPAIEIGKRLKVPATNISKHCVVLHRCGILKRDYGLYKIHPAHLIPGERALDLGAVVIRLDRAELVKS